MEVDDVLELPLGNPWGMAGVGGLSLLEQDALRGLRGRSTPVQEGWDTTGDRSLRSLGASRGELFTTALLLDVSSGL